MNLPGPRMGLGDAGFRPGIASANAAGIRATSQVYPMGDAGVQLSLAVVAQKIRDGAVDPDVMGWARTVLKNKGLDGRLHPSVKAQVQALLDELRSSVIYAPDAYGREVIQSAAATLCLRPGLCINGGDCDDLCVALGAASLSLGIPTRVVKQTFYGASQEHVLIQCQDEQGTWLSADPSVMSLPVGSSHRADEEQYIDPMETGLPELVSIGRPDETRDVVTLGAFSRREVGLAPSHPAWTHPGHDVRAPANMRAGRGRWWGWSGRSWVLVTPTTCASWSPPVVPIPAVLSDASAQLEASGGQPVTKRWDAQTTFLYTKENGAVVVRVCTSKAPLGRPLGAPRPVGVGVSVPTPQNIHAELLNAYQIWTSLRADVDVCHTAPGTSGACPPGYTTEQGGGACTLTATLSDGTTGATTTTTTTVPAGVAPLDDTTYANFYTAYDTFLIFYDKYFDLGQVNNQGGIFTYNDLLQEVYDYQNQAYKWQLQLNPICKLTSPVIDPTPRQQQGLLDALFKPSDVTTAGKILVTGAIVGAVAIGLWFSWPLLSSARGELASRAPKPRPEPARSNPLGFTNGEALAVGGAVLSGAVLGTYLGLRTPAPAMTSTPAPAALPGTTLQEGHEYRIVVTNISTTIEAPLTTASIQSEFDAEAPGAFHVKSLAISGTTATVIADVIGPLPAGFTITDPETTFQDLGPIPGA